MRVADMDFCKVRKCHYGKAVIDGDFRAWNLNTWCRNMRSTERGSRVGQAVMVSPGSMSVSSWSIGWI